MQDGIACYNIGNKYCHTIVMQLMAEGELSFLAIQGTHKTWRAFETKELDMLRYTSVSLQWHLVIYDNMKWGGRETENPEVHLDGRVITMAFALAPGLKIGIASVYRKKTRGGSTSQEQARAVEAGRQGDVHNSVRGLPGDSHKHSCGQLGSVYERAGAGWISGLLTADPPLNSAHDQPP